MLVQQMTDSTGSFLVLDDQGRIIGRIERSVLALAETPPQDTVLLQPAA